MSKVTYYTLPEGQIVAMALSSPQTNTFKDNREEFYCRVLIDGTTEEGKEAKAFLNSVNKKLVVTESESLDIPEGYFTVRAWSGKAYPPAVYDYSEQQLEQIPYFTSGASGTAIMTVKAKQGEKGGTINLVQVALGDFTPGKPSEFMENGISRTLHERLKEVNK